jgi:hypothetical protein
MKIYRLSDVTGYTYNMSEKLRKDMLNATQMTATHATVKSFTRGMEGVAHKLMWTISFALQLYLLTCTDENCKGMPRDFDKDTKIEMGSYTC